MNIKIIHIYIYLDKIVLMHFEDDECTIRCMYMYLYLLLVITSKWIPYKNDIHHHQSWQCLV
jgi:hypothetical protein